MLLRDLPFVVLDKSGKLVSNVDTQETAAKFAEVIGGSYRPAILVEIHSDIHITSKTVLLDRGDLVETIRLAFGINPPNGVTEYVGYCRLIIERAVEPPKPENVREGE